MHINSTTLFGKEKTNPQKVNLYKIQTVSNTEDNLKLILNHFKEFIFINALFSKIKTEQIIFSSKSRLGKYLHKIFSEINTGHN